MHYLSITRVNFTGSSDKNKKIGVKEVVLGEKLLIEAVV